MTAAFIARMRPRLGSYFRKRHLGREDAEDLAQEALCRAEIRIRRFRRGSYRLRNPLVLAEAFAYGIAEYVLREHWRSLGRHPVTEPNSGIEIAAEDHDWAAEDQVLDLQRALADLRPRLRQVTELRFFVGLTQMEAAIEMRITERHARRLEGEAIEALKAFLAGDDPMSGFGPARPHDP